MNPHQGEVIPTATTSLPNEETQELTRLFHQTKKTLPILSYNGLTEENIKPMLDTFAGYEPSHESPSFSINDEKDVTTNLINVSAAFQNTKYRDNSYKPEMWL